MSSQQQALAAIRGEHRTLTAMVDALKNVADDIAAGQLKPDYRLLWSIMYYVEEFPEALHHPKEEQVLFPRIRLRCADIDDTLDELGRQHATSRPHLERLKTLLGHMEAEIPGAATDFSAKVAAYAAFQHRHIEQEETVVLPKAVEVLTPQDWDAIAASFGANLDPMREGAATSSDWFAQFFRRIVTLVPEPWGVGARR